MLAFYFLYDLVGVSAVAGMAVLLVLLPTNVIGQSIGMFVLHLLPVLLATHLIGQNIGIYFLLVLIFLLPLAGKKVETEQMALKDQRVLLMNEILQGIKVTGKRGEEVRI